MADVIEIEEKYFSTHCLCEEDILYFTPKQLIDPNRLGLSHCNCPRLRFKLHNGYYVFYCGDSRCHKELFKKKKIIGKPQNRQYIRSNV